MRGLSSEAMKHHIVFYSSGIDSFCAAKRVVEEQGADSVTLLFADTLTEDEDNYRFLFESCRALEMEQRLTVVAEGRDVFQLWHDEKAISNNRMPFCSRKLKREICKRWVSGCYAPNDVVLYFGFGWHEPHRLKSAQQFWLGYQVEAPLLSPPFLDKYGQLNEARNLGLRPPRLYDLGFAHANCGGGCVRAGQAHWQHLYRVLPHVFERWESEEKLIRQKTGKPIAILTRNQQGVKTPFPLSELKKQIESNGQLDLWDWGGCGCF